MKITLRVRRSANSKFNLLELQDVVEIGQDFEAADDHPGHEPRVFGIYGSTGAEFEHIEDRPDFAAAVARIRELGGYIGESEDRYNDVEFVPSACPTCGSTAIAMRFGDAHCLRCDKHWAPVHYTLSGRAVAGLLGTVWVDSKNVPSWVLEPGSWMKEAHYKGLRICVAYNPEFGPTVYIGHPTINAWLNFSGHHGNLEGDAKTAAFHAEALRYSEERMEHLGLAYDAASDRYYVHGKQPEEEDAE